MNVDIPEEFIRSFAEKFVCRSDRYDVQRNGGGYLTIYQALTLNEIRQHLSGEITIAGFTIDEANLCREIAFDEDQELGGLNRIHSLVAGWGLKPILEGSRWTKPTSEKPQTTYKPGHLRLVLNKKIASKVAYQFARQVAAMADASHLECNPKAPELKQGGTGTVLKLPLAINRKYDSYPDERAWFEGVEKNLVVQLKWVHESLPVNDADYVVRLAKELPPMEQSQPKRRQKLGGQESLLKLVPADYPLRLNGSGQFITGCAACVIEGHDRSRSNLTINADGNMMHCFYDGHGGRHDFHQILAAFRHLEHSAQAAI
jgi:hypothetical protein